MNQGDFKFRIERYADNEMHGGERSAFEAEIAERPEIMRRIEELRGLRAAVARSLDSVVPPAGLAERVQSRLRSPRYKYSFRSAVPMAIAAAILLFAIGPRWGGPIEVEPWRFTSTFNACAKLNSHNEWEHIPVVGQPVSVGSRFRVAIPDLRSLGFVVDGVCHCQVKCPEFSAVHIHYRKPATNPGAADVALSIFPIDRPVVFRKPSSKTHHSATRRDYEFATWDGFHLMHWRSGDGAVAVCTELSDEAMTNIANQVRFEDEMRLADGSTLHPAILATILATIPVSFSGPVP